jgi:hypothetical protein
LIQRELAESRGLDGVARATRCGWGDTVSFAPSGLDIIFRRDPRLAPWAVFLRRFAAGEERDVSEVVAMLYRPVGQAELDLIRASGFRKFPPRLPEQPIFYPVLTEEYAAQIARDWNTKDERSGLVGFVTRFAVCTDYLSEYEVHVVGDSSHREYWIPAQDLERFNENIVGTIEVVGEFRRG